MDWSVWRANAQSTDPVALLGANPPGLNPLLRALQAQSSPTPSQTRDLAGSESRRLRPPSLVGLRGTSDLSSVRERGVQVRLTSGKTFAGVAATGCCAGIGRAQGVAGSPLGVAQWWVGTAVSRVGGRSAGGPRHSPGAPRGPQSSGPLHGLTCYPAPTPALGFPDHLVGHFIYPLSSLG